MEPSKVETIVLCVVVLHNYLRRTHPGQCSAETSFHTVNGENDEIMMMPLQRLQRRPTNEARVIREGFMRYFVNEGAVERQIAMCNNH